MGQSNTEFGFDFDLFILFLFFFGGFSDVKMNKYCKIKNDMMHNRRKSTLSSTGNVL